jgi:hypothetical protein
MDEWGSAGVVADIMVAAIAAYISAESAGLKSQMPPEVSRNK